MSSNNLTYIDVYDPYGFIYIITDLLNGKRYIGQKKLDTASRWKSYMGGGYHLLKSIEKNGKENFIRSIVAIGYSREELNELEETWINNYNAVKSDHYYNRIDGGGVIDSLSRRNSTPCICIDNNMKFDSIADASVWCRYTYKRISQSFKQEHTYKNKEEGLIFRPLSVLKIGFHLCKICGRNYKKTTNHHQKCDKCRNKKKIDYTFSCTICKVKFLHFRKSKKCDNCSNGIKRPTRHYIRKKTER